MDNVCPMLGVLPAFYEKIEKCLKDTKDYDNDQHIKSISDPAQTSLCAPSIKIDDSSDLIPDDEHEYRLRLRMLQYRFRNQPRKL